MRSREYLLLVFILLSIYQIPFYKPSCSDTLTLSALQFFMDSQVKTDSSVFKVIFSLPLTPFLCSKMQPCLFLLKPFLDLPLRLLLQGYNRDVYPPGKASRQPSPTLDARGR